MSKTNAIRRQRNLTLSKHSISTKRCMVRTLTATLRLQICSLRWREYCLFRMPKIYFGFFLFFDLIQQPMFGAHCDFFVIYANVNIHFAIVFVFHGYAHNIFVGIYPQSMHYLLMVEVK